jgi:transcriptional regulator with XRE-family HTH domain
MSSTVTFENVSLGNSAPSLASAQVSRGNTFPQLTWPVVTVTLKSMAKSQGAFYEQLGKQIKKAREAAKVTQEQLANTLHLTRTSVTNIERGRQPVMTHVLVQIASALNTNLAELIPSPEAVAPTRKVTSQLKKLDNPEREWVTRILAHSSQTSKKD